MALQSAFRPPLSPPRQVRLAKPKLLQFCRPSNKPSKMRPQAFLSGNVLLCMHVMVKCIEGLWELWRVGEMYTVTQVERHRALTTKFSKACGAWGWSPSRRIHWCLAHSTFFVVKWRNIFQFSSIPTEYRHGPYKRRLQNFFQGLVLGEAKYVPPQHAPWHVHERPGARAFGTGGSQGLGHWGVFVKKDQKCFVSTVLPCLSY